MRVTFHPDDTRFVAEEGVLICAFRGRDASGFEHYLTLQRAAEDGVPPDDAGVYIEFDDQSQGGYGLVAACRLDARLFSLDLSESAVRLAGAEGFDIVALNEPWSVQVRDGLRRIFRGMPDAVLPRG